MSLAKVVISGVVFRAPEKRFTKNDVAITSFTLNIDEKAETLLRVIAKGNMAENVERSVVKGAKVVVEGKLQTVTLQGENGVEKKTLEIDLQSFELLSGSNSQVSNTTSSNSSEVVKFSETEEFAEDLIGEEEIPF